jgi:hypothetical protein
MPIFDYKCTKCEAVKQDELVKDPDASIFCDFCGQEMTKLQHSFSFTFTPGPISKFKKKYGKHVPSEYKTGAGANIYGVPHKN